MPYSANVSAVSRHDGPATYFVARNLSSLFLDIFGSSAKSVSRNRLTSPLQTNALAAVATMWPMDAAAIVENTGSTRASG